MKGVRLPRHDEAPLPNTPGNPHGAVFRIFFRLSAMGSRRLRDRCFDHWPRSGARGAVASPLRCFLLERTSPSNIRSWAYKGRANLSETFLLWVQKGTFDLVVLTSLSANRPNHR